ncbi:hypothetical protein KC19_VG118300 [Ceratodon purpureus]|uniref:Uncharacterized protein n=1 Tax=Ceratodon purpureus TaxID=3225 RepID=A0A8T0HPI6_CERPU|nr:hypothetical protein KC19_VG118300 [Ceratodon purpureus]
MTHTSGAPKEPPLIILVLLLAQKILVSGQCRSFHVWSAPRAGCGCKEFPQVAYSGLSLMLEPLPMRLPVLTSGCT